MIDRGPTLFECQPEPRKFWLWTWLRETHAWVELSRWRTPLHYGTAFHTEDQCIKCWERRISTVEAYGP